MKNNKRIVALLSGILIALLVIVVLLAMKGKTKTNDGNIDGGGETEVVSTVEEMIAAEEPFTIETKYCDLHYPEKWENQVFTEITEEGDAYAIQFFAELEDKDSVHIFDIVFDGEDGALTGYFSKDGEEIPVYIVGMEIDTEGWTDEELIELYIMHDVVFFFFCLLLLVSGF